VNDLSLKLMFIAMDRYVEGEALCCACVYVCVSSTLVTPTPYHYNHRHTRLRTYEITFPSFLSLNLNVWIIS